MARARTGTLSLHLRSLDEPGSKLGQASIIWLVTIGISGGNQMNELYWIPLGVAVCFVLYLILGSFFTVRTAEVAVITRFGKFLRVAEPGLNWKSPFFDTVAGRVSLRVIQITLTMEKIGRASCRERVYG